MSNNYCKYCNRGTVATKRDKMCAKIRQFHAKCHLKEVVSISHGTVYKSKEGIQMLKNLAY